MRTLVWLILSLAYLPFGCKSEEEPSKYGSWKALGPLPDDSLIGSCAAPLDDGRVLVAGGPSADARSTWLYDPTNDAWASGPPMNEQHETPGCRRLADGRVAVFGGLAATTMELFDPKTMTWSPHALRATPVRLLSVLADGRIVVVGRSTEPASAAVDVFDPATEMWTSLPPPPVAVDPKVGAVLIALPGSRVLMSVGKSSDILDVDARRWMPGPVPTEIVSGGGATTRDGRLAVVCGRFHAFAFDTAAMEWRRFEELSKSFRIVPDCGAGVVAMADGRLLALGVGDATIISPDVSFVLAAALPNGTLGNDVLPRVGLSDGRVVVFGLDGSSGPTPKIVAIFTP